MASELAVCSALIRECKYILTGEVRLSGVSMHQYDPGDGESSDTVDTPHSLG